MGTTREKPFWFPQLNGRNKNPGPPKCPVSLGWLAFGRNTKGRFKKSGNKKPLNKGN